MSTGKYKLLNGVQVEMTQSEVSQQTKSETVIFNEAMENLRAKRNKLLAETDHYALSDQTLSDDMRTYRQSLRDLTDGLTTKAEVDAVVFPTKP